MATRLAGEMCVRMTGNSIATWLAGKMCVRMTGNSDQASWRDVCKNDW